MSLGPKLNTTYWPGGWLQRLHITYIITSRQRPGSLLLQPRPHDLRRISCAEGEHLMGKKAGFPKLTQSTGNPRRWKEEWLYPVFSGLILVITLLRLWLLQP